MKNILLGLLFLLFLLFSCDEKQKLPSKQVKEETKYHKLSIVVDSLPSDIGFYTPFLLWNSDIDGEDQRKYNEIFDTITKKTTYQWDTLITGDYIFKTLSYKEESFSLSISKDTTIKIKNNLNLEYIDKFDKNPLLKADTIEILYEQRGCFKHYFEKSILIKDKKDNSYFVSTYFNNNKSLKQHKANVNIVKNLLVIQNELLKLHNNLISTSEETFTIFASGEVFEHTKAHEGWHIYGEFKKKYITIE